MCPAPCVESSEVFPDFWPGPESFVYPRRRFCYLGRRVIDVAQGHVAKLIDAAAVMLLWRFARGRATDQEREIVALFPPLLHIATHVHLPMQQVGRVNSVVGTWSRENLLDYLVSGPGTARAGAVSGAGAWTAAIGTESAFPTPLPTMTWHTRDPGRPGAFALADADSFEPDAGYLTRTAAWYRREGRRDGLDDREREAALSAGRIAELWLDSVQTGALEQLDAFELELRLRRMGMAGGDVFAQRFGWSHALIGVNAVRAFNRLLAAWAAATLMPEPFRLGLLDRCLAHPGLCAVLLAASASVDNFERAAADRRAAPRSLPLSGVRYAGPAGGDPAPDMPVHRLIKPLHGVPIFAPLGGHPEGLWEMFIAVRVERVNRPAVFRQPSPLALRREMESIHSILVRLGPGAPGSEQESVQLETIFLSDMRTVGDIDRHAAAAGGASSRALRALWRARR